MNSITILIILASVAVLPATDIYLPSLPRMAIYFKVSEELMRSTITACLLGGLVASLPMGIMSDRFGRRPIMLFGLVTFVIGNIFCAAASDITLFMVGRFLQGAGSICIPIVGFAIIHDIYEKDKAAQIMAWLGGIYSLSPLLAPSFGGFIQVSLGWRWNFIILGFLTIMSVALLALKLPETRPQRVVNKFSIGGMLESYKQVLSGKRFMLYVLIFAVICCGEWCYLAIMPFYFERILGLRPHVCGLYISAIGLSYLIGALLTSRLVTRIGSKQTIAIGIGAGVLGAALLLLVYFVSPSQPAIIASALAIYMTGIALVWGPTTSSSFQYFKDLRGTASSIRSLTLTASFVFGSFSGSLLSFETLLPLSLFLLACALGSLYLFHLLGRFVTPNDDEGTSE